MRLLVSPVHWVGILNKIHINFCREHEELFLYRNAMAILKRNQLEQKRINFNNSKLQQLIYFLKAFTSWIVFFLISSEWQLEPVVVMATMQRDLWRGKQDTNSNPALKWNGKDCPGTNISTESCNFHKCQGKLQKLKTSKV